MSAAIETRALGRRYGNKWALRELTLSLPLGHVIGLVGPNGAGKSTFLQLAIGLQRPSEGVIEVMGSAPSRSQATLLPRLGYVPQESTLPRRFRVGDLLTLGAKLNRQWDAAEAERRLRQLGIGLELPVASLSGGMRMQVSLTLALAKQPELLLLDEPVAALDPLARHEFMQLLMDAAAERGLSVIFSSHLVGELHESCDYLVVLADGRAQLEGDVDEIIASHSRLVGPTEALERACAVNDVVSRVRGERQSTLLVHNPAPQFDPRWSVEPVDLEEIIVAHLRNAAAAAALNGRRAA